MLRESGERETILLVDDDAAVRALVARVLRTRGYDVVEASSGEDAEAVYHARERPIQLLVCDVFMGGLGGPELAERLQRRQPGLRTLLMSGDPTVGSVEGDPVLAGAFISKPFSSKQLLDRITDLLSG